MIAGIIVGIIAGAIAGWIMRGEGYGFWKNLVLGLFGGLVGGWIFDLLGLEWGGLLGEIGTAVVGAVALIWIARRISK
ncbi:MAG: GlsB/YeaQ/YmgE family stress response membrane protein [Bacteroidaceae bacterium]|nr:GlsB/YeaQ/YmgE family stress response membrane protein [Bacteroidaceae bacterium]MBQ9191469.1 GlsB/YeaQ/YmgE family stress response membrane protein [Bacteroidaceae bacterium]MBR0244522.1 GlsB/YeaQ/YmgE family stress response membrane protein [Bacteroidaceae bacterium]